MCAKLAYTNLTQGDAVKETSQYIDEADVIKNNNGARQLIDRCTDLLLERLGGRVWVTMTALYIHTYVRSIMCTANPQN